MLIKLYSSLSYAFIIISQLYCATLFIIMLYFGYSLQDLDHQQSDVLCPPPLIVHHVVLQTPPDLVHQQSGVDKVVLPYLLGLIHHHPDVLPDHFHHHVTPRLILLLVRCTLRTPSSPLRRSYCTPVSLVSPRLGSSSPS